MLLTSTRAVPNAVVDVLSDYDVILILTDIRLFAESRDWLEDFGRVLTLYCDPIYPDGEFERSGNVIQYESGLKIDFTLWPVGLLRRIIAESQLPAELDAGYRVLLDKDHLTDDLRLPTYQAYIPTVPTERVYHECIEDFFLIAIYIAKLLWRDDLMAAKYIMDGMMKQERLLPMLEWQVEVTHGWSVKVGPYGRGLKKWLRPDLWAALESTYVDAHPGANWAALDRQIDLFRRVAIEVSGQLGYVYLHDLDRRTVAYIQKVKALDRGAQTLPPDWSMNA